MRICRRHRLRHARPCRAVVGYGGGSPLSGFRFPVSGFTLPKQRGRNAFTLIELMVVIAIIVVMTLLLVPAFKSMKSADDVTSAAYEIKGVLEQARTFAMTNNTYTWVGFYEELGSTSSTTPATAGTGRIVISAVASKDGTRYRDTLFDETNPPAFDNSVSPRPLNNRVVLVQLGKLIRLDNAHSAATQVGPTRPTVVNDYRLGNDLFARHPKTASSTSVLNPTTFTYPLSGTAQYVFQKAIEFSPKGSATKICDYPTELIDIAIQPTHGSVADSANPNIFAIQIGGITGNIEIYRK